MYCLVLVQKRSEIYPFLCVHTIHKNGGRDVLFCGSLPFTLLRFCETSRWSWDFNSNNWLLITVWIGKLTKLSVFHLRGLWFLQIHGWNLASCEYFCCCCYSVSVYIHFYALTSFKQNAAEAAIAAISLITLFHCKYFELIMDSSQQLFFILPAILNYIHLFQYYWLAYLSALKLHAPKPSTNPKTDLAQSNQLWMSGGAERGAGQITLGPGPERVPKSYEVFYNYV